MILTKLENIILHTTVYITANSKINLRAHTHSRLTARGGFMPRLAFAQPSRDIKLPPPILDVVNF